MRPVPLETHVQVGHLTASISHFFSRFDAEIRFSGISGASLLPPDGDNE